MTSEAPVDIFITSYNRTAVTGQVLRAIRERTHHPYKIHVFDNGSVRGHREWLFQQFQEKHIDSVHFHKWNTFPYYPKVVFHSMVESSKPYYVVTDSDIEPPDLGESCWLTVLLAIARRKLHSSRLAVLSAQVPPVSLYKPYGQDDEVVYCHAVGNILKVVNREVAEFGYQKEGLFGDDEILCAKVREKGYRVAYARRVFARNLGQLKNWGYASPEEYAGDPRKASEPPPLFIPPIDEKTFETAEEHQYEPGVRFHYEAPLTADSA
jgi:hypothetical protein